MWYNLQKFTDSARLPAQLGTFKMGISNIWDVTPDFRGGWLANSFNYSAFFVYREEDADPHENPYYRVKLIFKNFLIKIKKNNFHQLKSVFFRTQIDGSISDGAGSSYISAESDSETDNTLQPIFTSLRPVRRRLFPVRKNKHFL